MIYELSNGKVIEDEKMSSIMEFLTTHDVVHSDDYTWDNIGTATLMSDVYGEILRYCPQNGCWYLWDDCWTKQDDSGVIMDMLQTLLNLLSIYQRELPNDEQNKESYGKFLRSIRNYRPMVNVLETLKTALNIRINLWDMDSNPYLINTTVGAFNLKTGEKIADTRQYNVTQKTNCGLPDFTTVYCRRWYEFIDEITSHNKEKAAFLQRALGYSILGVNREECMFIAYGATTRNGKGTLFSSITAALGSDYVGTISPDLICEKRNGKTTDFNAAQPALSRVAHSRIVTMAESEMGVMLDSASIKTLTGRDKLMTRGLYEKPYEFTPQFTMWMNTNYLPNVNDLTVFDSDRIWVIPFCEHFTGESQNKDLKEIFSAPENRPTILKWLYDGCREYLEKGLEVPECVIEATQDYRDMHDKIRGFLNDTVADLRNEVNQKDTILRGDLYTAYRNWCMRGENKYTPMSSTSFYSEIKRRGYELMRRNNGWFFKGMSFKV